MSNVNRLLRSDVIYYKATPSERHYMMLCIPQIWHVPINATLYNAIC